MPRPEHLVRPPHSVTDTGLIVHDVGRPGRRVRQRRDRARVADARALG